ncbi:MAG: TIGR03862 family flavoprotein [Burkholderiales bacterium]|nr:MAG: TIGR03862 family flavoprotein [Burkholderiales bacterium]
MKTAAVIGGGPAGLMAAEELALAGVQVDVYDAMPSVGRKFLLAGIGGLNITHAEPLDQFTSRYGSRSPQVTHWLEVLSPSALRDWVQGLGIETFVGTSQRVFPAEMKAAPLLRAWLHRLRGQGVRFHARHRWLGWAEDGSLRFSAPAGELAARSDATVLALGGASWKKLGSDGAWLPWLRDAGVQVNDLQPSNCGFDLEKPWSEHLRAQFAGQPVKPVALSFKDSRGNALRKQGEFVITETGVEGSLVYAASSLIRDEIAGKGQATIHLDLLPAFSAEKVQTEVSHPRGSKSLSAHLKSRLNLHGLKSALLYEVLSKEQMHDMPLLAQTIKALPLTFKAPRPIDEAISSAGGVALEAMNDQLMLSKKPGTFCAGEMLDWEAPTGGYLLTACWASGRQAGRGAAEWLGVARQLGSAQVHEPG